MPRALAIETSGRVGSVALADDNGVLSELEFPHGLKHAAEIIPIIDRLCREHAWRPADIENIFVSAGPGSFTGLRIGITLAKTLAFATGAQVVAVPSVRVLVENAPPGARHVIIVLDAKREQIFTARFGRDSAAVPWSEVEPARLDSLAAMLARSPRPVHLLGEGIPFHEKFIPEGQNEIIVCPPDSARARAGVVARLGEDLARAGRFADPYRLTPIYIRPPEAQEKFDAAQTTLIRDHL
jgi:tRNA threonylcarbamoyladenosine biosynthesis protein TsaB